MNVYLDTATYNVLITSIAADMPPCRWTGQLDFDGARLVLGQRCDIWPASILTDARANGHEQELV